MKRVFAILLCVCLIFTMFGCDDKEDATSASTSNGLLPEETDAPEETQTPEVEVKDVCLVYDPEDNFNPYQTTGYTNRVLFSLVYQGLFTVSADYQVSPMLCSSYNLSADQRTYTFYIADANFSDGTAVTAADVVASLNAAKGSAWYGNRLQHVNSISSYGDAVVLELDTPMENLPILLDIPIVKADFVDDRAPLGTGPYALVGGQLRRQAAWWCTATLPFDCDTIQLVSGETAAEIRDAFEFDHVSLVCTDPSSTDYVSFHSDYELWDCENGLFLYLVCNPDYNVFSNPELRAALTHAIDRDTIATTYFNGFADTATLPVSPRSPYYSSALANNFGYNPAKFRDAVLNAQLETMELTMLVNGENALRVKIAKSIAAMMEEYGFTVNLIEATGDDYLYLLAKGNYDLYLGQTRLSANMDLSAFFGTNSSLSYGGLSDPATYATCLEALADSDNYYTLCEMIMEDGSLCPILFQTNALYVQRGSLTDFAPARDNIFYYELAE